MADKAWDQMNEKYELEANNYRQMRMREILKSLSDYEALYNVYGPTGFVAVKRGSTIKREIEQGLISGNCYWGSCQIEII
jgi:hypothetical protein